MKRRETEILHRVFPGLDEEELAELVAAANRVRAALDAFDVRCARRSRELAEQGRADSLESMFTSFEKLIQASTNNQITGRMGVSQWLERGIERYAQRVRHDNN